MLVSKLDKKTFAIGKKAKKICLATTVSSVFGGGEIASCREGHGKSISDDAKTEIANILDGEVCQGTIIYSAKYYGLKSRVDLEIMEKCHYRIPCTKEKKLVSDYF